MAEGGGVGILTPSTIGVFAACVVPGYVGMLAYRLRQPGDSVGLKDGLLEAVAFGIVNFVLTWPQPCETSRFLHEYADSCTRIAPDRRRASSVQYIGRRRDQRG